jgi:hypothetical protein
MITALLLIVAAGLAVFGLVRYLIDVVGDDDRPDGAGCECCRGVDDEH